MKIKDANELAKAVLGQIKIGELVRDTLLEHGYAAFALRLEIVMAGALEHYVNELEKTLRAEIVSDMEITHDQT